MLEKIDKIQALLNVPNVNADTETAIADMKILNLLVDLRAEAKQLILSGVINWVAVNERLPTEQTDVITYSKEFEVRNGRCMQKGSWFVNGYSRLVNVTHWAELPKPPCCLTYLGKRS